MSVYLAMRKGNWLWVVLSMMWPWRIRPWFIYIIRWFCRDSWMSSALYFSRECTRNSECLYCAKGTRMPPSAYHFLRMYGDHETHQILSRVDDNFDKPEAWILIRLNVTDTAAYRFFIDPDINSKGYNMTGFMLNFLPIWFRFYWQPIGVQLDFDTKRVDTLFCSEMICVFLKRNGYPLGTVPCLTTPQILYDTLLDRYPALKDQTYRVAQNQKLIPITSK